MAANNYAELLAFMQNSRQRMEGQIPEGQPYINIDWNQRSIELTSDFNPFLIEGDHYAQSIWFCCDRFLGTVDLLEMTCVIEYFNPVGEARLAPILMLDVTTDPEKIFFCWEVNGEASRMGNLRQGQVQFVVRFYAVDPSTNRFEFNIGTMPCAGNVLKGLPSPEQYDDNFGYPAEDIKAIYSRMTDLEKAVDQQSINWWDLEPEITT